jgi:glycosyltransferase involved in cell wall biosynthesis
MISASDFSAVDGPVLHFCSVFEAIRKSRPGTRALVAARGAFRAEKGMTALYTTRIRMIASIVFQVRLFLTLVRILRHEKDAVLYVRTHYSMVAPLLLSRWFRVPMVSEFNGIIDDLVQKRPRWVIALGKAVEKRLASASRAVVAVTPRMSAWIAGHYEVDEQKIHTVPNGADPSRFPDKSRRTALRNEQGIPEGAFVFGYVGTLIWWQGVEVLLDALARLFESKHRAKVLAVVAGDGPEMKSLRSRARRLGVEDRVRFAGAVPRETAAEIMCLSDVAVAPKMPLESGYSPLKLYEYLASGTPVAASRLPGFEIVEESGAGWLFEAGNAKDLAARLEQALETDQETLHRMGRNGRERIARDFSWEGLSKRILEVIDGAGRRARGRVFPG